MTTAAWSPTEAIDAAFAGAVCEAISGDGAALRLPTHRWTREADRTDHDLFVERCFGATIDVGCGPGRLTGALVARDVPAMGIDVSPEAVRQARVRGARALLRDVFAHVPGIGTWRHALLADGNVGIGGDPVRLLRRVRELMHPDGTALVEVDGPGTGVVHHSVRLRVGNRMSAPFDWAVVGVDAIEELAAASGLHVVGLKTVAHRHVVELCGVSRGVS